jgi:hypothetical protein
VKRFGGFAIFVGGGGGDEGRWDGWEAIDKVVRQSDNDQCGVLFRRSSSTVCELRLHLLRLRSMAEIGNDSADFGILLYMIS